MLWIIISFNSQNNPISSYIIILMLHLRKLGLEWWITCLGSKAKTWGLGAGPKHLLDGGRKSLYFFSAKPHALKTWIWTHMFKMYANLNFKVRNVIKENMSNLIKPLESVRKELGGIKHDIRKTAPLSLTAVRCSLFQRRCDMYSSSRNKRELFGVSLLS